MSDQRDLVSRFQAQRAGSMSAQGNALGNLHAMISSPNGAALIFAVASSNLFRSAPLGLFVLEIPKPRALP